MLAAGSSEVRARAMLLRRRPAGLPMPEDFEVVDRPVPAPGPGEVLVKTLFLSIDPYMRGRLSDQKSYARPVAVGEVMTGETVGEVLASHHPGFAAGDLALGLRGWQTHGVAAGETLTRIVPEGPPASLHLGVLGMPGTTAYSGMTDIGRPKAGETVLVTAASGAVGSVAGQLGKRAGARVVGVAGGAEKCRFVTDVLGFDACIDHRDPEVAAALAAATPDGVDVFFENVGGALQPAIFDRLNPFGRVVMCGMVAQYNADNPPPGPNLGLVVRYRLHIQGLIVSDRPERFAEWRALATPWVEDGSLRYREDVVEGLENAPAALAAVLSGRNFGKMVVRVG